MRKRKVLILLIIIAACAFICAAAIFFFLYQHTSSDKPSDRYAENIPQFHSSHDEDGDGTDDQTDILQGALDYVSTHPKYKSKYYTTGYPDDGYGVCTDVVANALKTAGYDLMDLVSEDIAQHPDNYDIEKPDKNIRHRGLTPLRKCFT